jgi:hypothetical protein
MFMCLFINDLFYDAVSNSDYIASNYMIVNNDLKRM